MKKNTADARWCPDCGTMKPIAEFYPHKKHAGGLTGYCKKCHNKHTYATQKKRRARIAIDLRKKQSEV